MLPWLALAAALMQAVNPALAQHDLRVGVIGPFSSGHPSSYIGESFKQALGVAKARVESGAEGWLEDGVQLPGRIEFIEWDDHSDPVVARNAARELIEKQHVHVILGSADSHSSEAIAAVCNELQVPHLMPISTAVKLVRPNGWTLRVALSNHIIVDTLLSHLGTNMPGCHLVYGYADTMYGRDLDEQTRRLVGDRLRNANPKGFELPQGLDQADFERQAAPLLQELKKTQVPLCIGLFVLSEDAARLAELVREADVEGPFVVAPGNASESFLGLAGPFAEGTISMASFFRLDGRPHIERFVHAYERATGHPPDSFAAQVYDAVHVLTTAYASFASDTSKLTRPELFEKISATSVLGATGRVTFTSSERNSDEVKVLRACRGRAGQLRFRPVVECEDLAEGTSLLERAVERWVQQPAGLVPPWVWASALPLVSLVLLLLPGTRRWALGVRYKPLRALALAVFTTPLVRVLLREPYANMKRTSLTVDDARSRFLPLPLRRRGHGTEVFRFDVLSLLRAPCVILGPSGAGKTRGLERVLQQIVDRKVRGDHIPFIVDARAFEDNLCKLVARTCDYGRSEVREEYIEALARQKSLLLLIDNACGLPRDRREKLRDQIERLIENGNRVILAAREQLAEFEHLGFVMFELAPVPEDQLDAYLQLHLPDAPDRSDLIEKLRGERLAALPRTPLMLKLVARSYRHHGRIASTTTGVYADYAAALIGGMRNTDPDGARFILHRLADEFYWKSGSRRGFSKQELIGYLGKLAEELRYRNVTASPVDLVGELRKVGLLRESAGRLSFSHDSLEDFFCAEHLYEMLVAECISEANVLRRSEAPGYEETYLHLHSLLGERAVGRFDSLRRTLREQCCPSLRAAATHARSALVSSAEMSACWRSEEPAISLDRLSGALSLSDGRQLAQVFREDTAPKIGRQVALRARVFLDVAHELLKSGEFAACISLGSGLSMLTSLLEERVGPAIRFYDSDLPSVVAARERRVKSEGFMAPRCLAFDLEDCARDKRSLASVFDASDASLFDGRRRVLFLMEGVLSFLTPVCRAWLFDCFRATNGALLFDYWAGDDNAEFRDMQQFFNTRAVAEDLHKLDVSSLVERLPTWSRLLDLDTVKLEAQFLPDEQLRKLGAVGIGGAVEGLSMRLMLLAHPSVPATLAPRLAQPAA